MVTTHIKKINITAYFKNLIFGLNIFYVLNTNVIFYVNHILFTIQSINLD